MALREIHQSLDGVIKNDGVRVEQQEILTASSLRQMVVPAGESEIVGARFEVEARVVPKLLLHGLEAAIARLIVDQKNLEWELRRLTYDGSKALQRHLSCVV